MTHTVTLLVADEMTGQARAREIQVRVTDTRIEDEQGRRYDKAMHGREIVSRRTPVTYRRRLDLATLRSIVRPRVRL